MRSVHVQQRLCVFSTGKWEVQYQRTAAIGAEGHATNTRNYSNSSRLIVVVVVLEEEIQFGHSIHETRSLLLFTLLLFGVPII